MDRERYERFYREAGRPEGLPWHRSAPPAVLERAAAATRRPGRALDLGCGSGTFAVWLAREGWDVTGIDFASSALAMARERAREAEVEVSWVQADVRDWAGPRQPFQLVVDSGCLHTLPPEDRRRFRRRLLSWLAPAADFVLVHFEKRHPLDWRPVGPRRVWRPTLVSFFAPELVLLEHDAELHRDLPFLVGPAARVGTFWFRRAALPGGPP